MNLADDLLRERVRTEQNRRAIDAAHTVQPSQDFGNLLYTDCQPQFHGTHVGVSQHAAADEALCQLYATFMREMVDARLAVRRAAGPSTHRTDRQHRLLNRSGE